MGNERKVHDGFQKEAREFLIGLDDILDRAGSSLSQEDIDLITNAYVFSSESHEGQKRKSGEPYFTHPVSVALTVAKMGLDPHSICAALLHDVVEDCEEVETKDVIDRFGPEVGHLVDGLTKLGKLNFTSKEDRQAESFRKMLIAMARDIRVILVKLCDRLDNMRTLEHMKTESQERIARETLEIYAPLAGRLGIDWVKTELEDLGFRYSNPSAYESVVEKIENATRTNQDYVDGTIREIQSMLTQRGFPVTVSGRQKNTYSIYRKMKRLDYEFDQIQDFLAFRVGAETVADCYASLGVIHSEWVPVPGRFKDYVALPKQNFYQSLHTTVIGPEKRRIEIQIRTHEMHKTAEQGIAAHWQYKQGKGSASDAEKFAWLRELLEHQKNVEDPAEFYESVRVDLFPDHVYIFTPKGDVQSLSRGATAVDFAYAIHSEVGDRCTGARVNGVMVPLKHKLADGDVVEIITRKNQQPSKDWLDFVVTSKARSRIRQTLRIEEREKSLALGREILDKAMHAEGLSASKFLKGKRVKVTFEKFKARNEEEFLADIAYGKINIENVISYLAQKDKTQPQKELQESFFEKAVRKVQRRDTRAIQIDGLDNVVVRFANCCSPVYGESVVGWITNGRGVSIHRHGCSMVMALDPARRVDVTWGGNQKEMALPVSLRVLTSDVPGILSRVSAVFTDNGINIAQANCEVAENGSAENVFSFSVTGHNELRSLMRGISRIKGVKDVERIGKQSKV